ncbi:MAG: hemerythrin domain-containing protein [Flavobacteriales bacterium]|nr:hemerythrin domain-containing protein [Flavobacteriales bacterium]
MEHNPLKVMYDEHEIIKQTEEIIKNLDSVWETDTQKYAETVTKLVDFFKEYADGYHHRKEEDVLFPAIKDHPDFVLQEIIDEFEEHHVGFREYAAEIREALSEEDYAHSYKILKRYIDELLDHIAAENEELFVLAENLMDEHQLETIYFKFVDVDMELGESRKKDFEKLINSML